MGIFAILTAVFMWSVGTVITKKGLRNPAPMLLNVAVQMIFAGIVLLVIQYFINPNYAVDAFSVRSELAVLYLAVFGSVADCPLAVPPSPTGKVRMGSTLECRLSLGPVRKLTV